MNIEPLIREHLARATIMQLATAANNQPWVCSVHVVCDDDLALYWMSVPDCRHSQEIAANPRAALTIAVHSEPPLIGVQIEGDAEQLPFEGQEAVLRLYAKRHNREHLVEQALGGSVPFKLYRLTPRLIVMFDQKNFPKEPRQEWRL